MFTLLPQFLIMSCPLSLKREWGLHPMQNLSGAVKEKWTWKDEGKSDFHRSMSWPGMQTSGGKEVSNTHGWYQAKSNFTTKQLGHELSERHPGSSGQSSWSPNTVVLREIETATLALFVEQFISLLIYLQAS